MQVYQEPYTMKRFESTKNPDGILYYFEGVEGINFPFQLYIPFKMSDNPDLVVANRTPGSDVKMNLDESILHAAYNYDKDGNRLGVTSSNPIGRFLSYNLGNICLMPVIPRVPGIESTYLGHDVYNNDFSKAINVINGHFSCIDYTDIDKFKDLHLQVENMIRFVIDYLKSQNINVDDKVIMTGHSAAAKFSMFFTALHPDLVKAVVAGATGGNNIIPVGNPEECQELSFLEPANLTYPLGTIDIPNFDFEAFSQIPQFYFIGEEDYNDLTKFKTNYEMLPPSEIKEGASPYVTDVCGNKIPRRIDGIKPYHVEIRDGKVVYIQEEIPIDKLDYILDKNGDYQLQFNDGTYTLEQVKYIVKNIGSNPQMRFKKMEEIYKSLGIASIFKKYNGDHITVYNDQSLYKDVAAFYASIKKEKVKTL